MRTGLRGDGPWKTGLRRAGCWWAGLRGRTNGLKQETGVQKLGQKTERNRDSGQTDSG